MDQLEQVWDRVRSGRHVVVIGTLPSELPSACGFHAVRVSCAAVKAPLGPILGLRSQVEQLLGGPVPILEMTADRAFSGLRRRLLGEMSTSIPGSAIVEILNQLKRSTDSRWAVLFDATEQADEDTLQLLHEMITRPGWLALPLILVFSTESLKNNAQTLVRAVAATEGPDSLIKLGNSRLPNASSASVVPLTGDLSRLPPQVLSVLRAGAIVGAGFEATLVAGLLGIEPIAVLGCLQQAADAGVPLTDSGESRFDLPPETILALRASMLPSLAIVWHRRLAELLTQSSEKTAPPPSETPSSLSSASTITLSSQASIHSVAAPPISTPASSSGDNRVLGTNESGKRVLSDLLSDRSEPSKRSAAAASSDPPPSAAASSAAGIKPVSASDSRSSGPPSGGSSTQSLPPVGESSPSVASLGSRRSLRATDMPALTASLNFDGKTRPPLRMEVLTTAPPSVRSAASQVSIPGASSSNTLTVTGSGLQSGEWTPYGGTSGSEARAAGHLVAAGEVETAAAHFLAGAKEAAAVGAYVQAIHNAREAVQLIESLPGSPRRRRLKIASLSELGRVQWQAAGPTGSATKFTLPDALTTLLAARQILETDDPADLRTTLVVLLASVYYDIGDRPSLERALDELTGASRMMIAAGDAVGAASLLNDQAAIYVRLGDPVRATHLLEESKRVFERLASSDPKAAMELAETNHLLARLPLHVPARPGREKEALDLGFRHARAAEAGYRRLGATRELTRVWESMGKLAMRSGLFEKATLSLMAALEVQRELGDLLGMARTTSTLADVLTEKGDYAGAVGLLAESINKNREKGSPIGLAFNRRSMESLARRMPEELHSLLGEARARLQEAEEVIGKADLAGDLIQSID